MSFRNIRTCCAPRSSARSQSEYLGGMSKLSRDQRRVPVPRNQWKSMRRCPMRLLSTNHRQRNRTLPLHCPNCSSSWDILLSNKLFTWSFVSLSLSAARLKRTRRQQRHLGNPWLRQDPHHSRRVGRGDLRKSQHQRPRKLMIWNLWRERMRMTSPRPSRMCANANSYMAHTHYSRISVRS